MLAVVTGGAGFIGSHVVERLLERGIEVAVIDDLSTGDAANVPAGVPLFVEDVTAEGAAGVVARLKPGCLVHLAAQPSAPASMDDPVADCRTNVLGTVRMLTAAAQSGCRRFVMASSAAVYGAPVRLPVDEDHPLTPLSFYGVSKAAGESYAAAFARARGMEYVMLRFANVYGPRQGACGEGGVVAVFIRHVLEGKPPVIYGDGSQTRDFVFVGDVAEATVLAALGRGSGVMNISTGSETSVNDLWAMIWRACGATVAPVYAGRRPGDIHRSVLDPRRANAALDWSAKCPLEEGIGRTIDWRRSTGVSTVGGARRDST
ncbi:MAG: NAD-dependent epimerase/dehydratase family protein [Ignavibacteriales bacterium]